MKLVIMTKATFFVEEDKILTTLFEEGLEDLHLYKPGSEPVYSERLLTLLPEDYYKKITVHDHFYLKEEFRLHGIHLNHPDDPLPYGYKGNLSMTCHHLEELKEAKKRSSYVFLRNVLDSQGESEEKQSFTEEQIRAAARQGLIDKHVYALSGINLDNVKRMKDLGFGGVVISTDLWERFNIHQEQDYKELIAHFNKLRKAVG
ncbi:MAG: thiamine phosphate synthase [Prevotella sp.]|nr:thiamine phosphate synthase [Prevotella sp.]